jgi:hypothetical protein
LVIAILDSVLLYSIRPVGLGGGGSVAFCIAENIYDKCARIRLALPTLPKNAPQDLQANTEGIFVSTPNRPFPNLDRSDGNAQGF